MLLTTDFTDERGWEKERLHFLSVTIRVIRGQTHFVFIFHTARFDAMRRFVCLVLIGGFIFAGIGCEKTITEPGEVEHGGVFLHASEHPQPTTRHFLFF
jgi:hypothetical protein